jgi:hypothetical protein
MLGYAGWKIVPWFGTHAIIPVVARVIQFIDKLDAREDKRDQAMADRLKKWDSDLSHLRSCAEKNGSKCQVSDETARALDRYLKGKLKDGNKRPLEPETPH